MSTAVANPVTGQMLLDIRPMITPQHVAGETIQERFEEFHRLNPWVLAPLETMVTEYLAAGRRRVGMKMLVEILRWNHDTRTTGDVFKLNNDMTSRYARRLVQLHPEWEKAIARRELRTA